MNKFNKIFSSFYIVSQKIGTLDSEL